MRKEKNIFRYVSASFCYILRQLFISKMYMWSEACVFTNRFPWKLIFFACSIESQFLVSKACSNHVTRLLAAPIIITCQGHHLCEFQLYAISGSWDLRGARCVSCLSFTEGLFVQSCVKIMHLSVVLKVIVNLCK